MDHANAEHFHPYRVFCRVVLFRRNVVFFLSCLVGFQGKQKGLFPSLPSSSKPPASENGDSSPLTIFPYSTSTLLICKPSACSTALGGQMELTFPTQALSGSLTLLLINNLQLPHSHKTEIILPELQSGRLNLNIPRIKNKHKTQTHSI